MVGRGERGWWGEVVVRGCVAGVLQNISACLPSSPNTTPRLHPRVHACLFCPVPVPHTTTSPPRMQHGKQHVHARVGIRGRFKKVTRGQGIRAGRCPCQEGMAQAMLCLLKPGSAWGSYTYRHTGIGRHRLAIKE